VRSARFVDRLGQGPMQRSKTAWLIGAFDLAAGDREAAAVRFRHAIDLFAAEPDMKLLAERYLAIAQADADFDRVVTTLEASGGEDAMGICEQLIVARAVFGDSSGRDMSP